MTFWTDLKNGLVGLSSVQGAFELLGYFHDQVVSKEDVEELSGGEVLEDMADASVREKSQLLGALPSIIAAPVLSDIYTAGFGVQVRRRVQNAYQQTLLSPMDYISYSYRYPDKEIDLRWYLSELGYNEAQEEIMSDLYKFYPNPGDFVRFGVREVFKPEIVAKYGYDDDFPEEIKTHMHKAGLTDEVMEWFWRAHWEMPSFYNIREARWRDKITDSEVDEWLTINDYAPYWRDIMKDILYTPYTRVDVRRMYDTGILGRDEVKRTYQDIGYDEEHAENLTEYTVVNSDKTKEVLSTYLNAYKRGIIDESELRSKMEEMNYSTEEIDLRIEMLEETDVVEKTKRSLTLTNVKSLFKKGLIDSYTLEDMLIELNYSDEAAMYMKLLILADSAAHKAWTKEIKKGYEELLLTRDEAVARLSDLGYSMEAINLSLALIDLELEVDE